MKTYDDFIDLMAEWIDIFKYARAHRKNEPFNQILFKYAMKDTLDWFETRPDKNVCKQYDLEIYNYLHEYSIIAVRLSKSGFADNGDLFSASQQIAYILTRYIVNPVMEDQYIDKYYIRNQDLDAELVFETEWADNVRYEYVYNFSTGDVQDFVDYLDTLKGKKPQPQKSNITNATKKRPVAPKPAPALKKAISRKPAVKKVVPKKHAVKAEPAVKKAAVKKPSVKKAAPKSKTSSSTKKSN